MAFSSRELSVLAYANGFTLWHYRTGESWAALLAPGYFLAADELLRPGDQILLTLARDGVPEAGMLVVTAVRPAAMVSVAPATALAPAASRPAARPECDVAAERRAAATC